MNEIIEKESIIIEDMIYEVRGVQVMLDSDLAKLYQVETKRVNEAVRNNLNKFPERFSFVMTDIEKDDLWSKFSTANISSKSRSNPRVFTEQGIYMLATILKSKVATEVSISIMAQRSPPPPDTRCASQYQGSKSGHRRQGRS